MTNIVIISGNVGQDPVTRTTQGGMAITTISVATSRRWNDKNTGETREETEWHRVTCFNGLGKNVAKFVRKGGKVLVEGYLHYTKWTGQDGVDRYGCEIIADKVEFLTKAAAPANGDAQAPAGEADLEVDDTVPF